MNALLKTMKRIIPLSLCLVGFVLPVSMPADSASSNEGTEVKIPVLLYHVVSEKPDSGNIYQKSLADFKKEMEYLNSNGYTTLSLDEYSKILDRKMAPPKNPVLLTFDDSTADFVSNVVPILNQYKMKATQFVVTGWLDNGSNHMTTADIKSIGANIDIQCHTVNHERLSSLDYDEQLKTIHDSQVRLKALTGKDIKYFAYPYGVFDFYTVTALKKLGFTMAFAVNSGVSDPSNDRFSIPRIIMSQYDDQASFIRKVNTGK